MSLDIRITTMDHGAYRGLAGARVNLDDDTDVSNELRQWCIDHPSIVFVKPSGGALAPAGRALLGKLTPLPWIVEATWPHRPAPGGTHNVLHLPAGLLRTPADAMPEVLGEFVPAGGIPAIGEVIVDAVTLPRRVTPLTLATISRSLAWKAVPVGTVIVGKEDVDVALEVVAATPHPWRVETP